MDPGDLLRPCIGFLLFLYSSVEYPFLYSVSVVLPSFHFSLFYTGSLHRSSPAERHHLRTQKDPPCYFWPDHRATAGHTQQYCLEGKRAGALSSSSYLLKKTHCQEPRLFRFILTAPSFYAHYGLLRGLNVEAPYSRPSKSRCGSRAAQMAIFRRRI
jgi:hypothetical protein